MFCVAVTAIAAASLCGDRQAAFPGPDELASDPQFAVVLDTTYISGERFLVLGTQQTFADLRSRFTTQLIRGGWKIRENKPITRQGVTAPPISLDEGFVAEKGDDCISYWNMNEGTFGAAGDRPQARRKDPDFDARAARYRTVFTVTPIHECV